ARRDRRAARPRRGRSRLSPAASRIWALLAALLQTWRSLLRLLEIAQVRRRLVLLDRHQQAVGAEEIRLVADADHGIVQGADGAGPARPRVGIARRLLEDDPRLAQRVIEHGDLVVDDVLVGLVEIDLLLDHGLAVLMERNAAGVVGARIFQ